MNNVILSVKHPEFARRLRALGYHVIPGENLLTHVPYEGDHADMQCLILDDTAFVADGCESLRTALGSRYNVVSCAGNIRGRYPDNVALNAAVVGSYVICRTDALDPAVRAYCGAHGYQLIHVRQGYAKCSCAAVGERAIITADKGIYNSVSEISEIDARLIGEGSVLLTGAEYGFIGGASGYDPDRHTLYFCGSVEQHPDSGRIMSFCEDHDVRIVSLTDEMLIDIGGIIFC